jgi:ABC-type spermidine/putrescine transport system permease subunit I
MSYIEKIKNIFPLLLWQALFLFSPIFLMLFKYFSYKNFIATTKWLIENNFLLVLERSFSCALIVSILSVGLAFFLAYGINQQSEQIKKIYLLLFLIPFISSFLIHMLSLINLFYKTSIINSFLSYFSIPWRTGNVLYSNFMVYLGYVYCYLPYAFIPLYNALLKFNTILLDASADLGATFYQSLFKVLLPNIKNALITSFLIVYISASSEFVIPEILGGDKQMHIGSAISYALLSSNLAECSIVMIIIFILILLLSVFVLYNLLVLFIHSIKKI